VFSGTDTDDICPWDTYVRGHLHARTQDRTIVLKKVADKFNSFSAGERSCSDVYAKSCLFHVRFMFLDTLLHLVDYLKKQTDGGTPWCLKVHTHMLQYIANAR